MNAPWYREAEALEELLAERGCTLGLSAAGTLLVHDPDDRLSMRDMDLLRRHKRELKRWHQVGVAAAAQERERPP